MVLGFDRDLNAKPTGMRTLGLVALGSASITVAALQLGALHGDPNAVSRVVQGVVQGVLTGVGFVGAGVVLRRPERLEVHGLTTAATVWLTAALGVVCGLGGWLIASISVALAVVLLVVLHPIERQLERRALDKRAQRSTAEDEEERP
jgi:putative Mg2+ transporter-C (MgtC) family protein